MPGVAIRYTKPPRTLKRPAKLEEVAFWPVTRLSALVERRLVTSTELTRMYLERLKRYQPKLLFYVTLTEELALKQAADADRAIAAGKYKGPLHGIPWGAKDLFATKGIKTTWGGEPYADQVFDYDATIVERLREAGAVLDVFRKLGAKLEPIEPSPDLSQTANAMNLILNVESGASFDDVTRSGEINALATGTSRSSWPNTFRHARFVPAVEYIKAMRARTILQHRMDAFMKWDAILSLGDSLSAVTNLTGHPAISMKCAIVGGRPRPLVITGRLYDEATIFRIALAYEQASE